MLNDRGNQLLKPLHWFSKHIQIRTLHTLFAAPSFSGSWFGGYVIYIYSPRKEQRNPSLCKNNSWYKHSRCWENSRQLCKPSTSSRVCITVSNPPNPSRVYIRLCLEMEFLAELYIKAGRNLSTVFWKTEPKKGKIHLCTCYFLYWFSSLV